MSDSRQRVGSYLVEEQLGRGGMGAVYRARHVQLGHEVALKLILDLEDAEPDLLERFHIEGQALARLRHEHLVAVLDAGRDARGRPWLAMELVEGEDLAERLKREGPLPPAEAALLVADLAEALAHAHERGVLHRDVKPSNVLLRASDGSALLTDFGLAKRLDRSGRLTQTGEVLGSPGFLAPEQCGSGEPNGPATDVYGLGALLFALLVGRPPCHGKGLIHTLHLVLEVPPTLPAEVPAELARICARCLEKAAAARYSSAAELATELRDWSAALAQTTPRPQRAPLAALALVVALLLGAWLGLRADPGAVPGRATWSPPASPTPPASANPQPSASPAPAPESAARRECLVAWKEGDAATLIQALERLPLPERAPLLYELSLDERSLSGPQLAAARLLEAPALLDASGQAALALLRATCALEEQRRRGTAQSMIASVEGVFEALEQPLPVARDLRLRVLFATRFPITQRVPREIVERLAGSALRRAREEPCPASLAALGLVFSLELDRAAAPFLTHALSSPWAEELAPLLREHLQKRCALALLIAGQPREALRVAQTIRTKGAGPELLIATCYEEAGDLAACRRILEGCTSEARARERLGWLVLQLGDLDALERLVAEAPQQRDWTSAALRACLRLARGEGEGRSLRQLLAERPRGVPVARVLLAERSIEEPALCRGQLGRALGRRCNPALMRRIGEVYQALGTPAEEGVVAGLLEQGPAWLPAALRTCEEVYAPAFHTRKAQLELAIANLGKSPVGSGKAEAWFRYGLAAARRQPLDAELHLLVSQLSLTWWLRNKATPPLIPDTPRSGRALREALVHLADAGPIRQHSDATMRARIAANAQARADDLAPVEAQLGAWLEANPQDCKLQLERALLRSRIGLLDEVTQRCFARASDLARGPSESLSVRLEWAIFRSRGANGPERQEGRRDLERIVASGMLPPPLLRHVLGALVLSAGREQAPADEARLQRALEGVDSTERSRYEVILAKAARRRGEPRRALELLAEARRGRELARVAPELLAELCLAHLACEQPAEALGVADTLLEVSPVSSARLLRCRALRLLGRRDEARAEFERLP